MSPEMEALARRAVACKGWGLIEAMLLRSGRNTLRVTEPSKFHNAEWLPDFTDPATLGCLLALARKKHRSSALQVSPRVDVVGIVGWRCYRNYDLDDHASWDASTEAGALVAALEAAP